MERSNKFPLAAGAILGALGVMAGAFGAHALKTRLEAPMLEVWETAARYEMYHAITLVAVAALPAGMRLVRAASTCFTAGVIIFSGSLYILALSGIKWLGAITPIGGLFLIAGWILLAVAAFSRRS